MKIFKTKFYKKKIIVTGHTGFKGSWLSLWLSILGAKVLEISHDTPTKPSNLKETTKLTISWYKEFYNNKKNIQNFSIDQIKYYERVLERKL
jgi:nucleoside-diphosphate-sugar epimerase